MQLTRTHTHGHTHKYANYYFNLWRVERMKNVFSQQMDESLFLLFLLTSYSQKKNKWEDNIKDVLELNCFGRIHNIMFIFLTFIMIWLLLLFVVLLLLSFSFLSFIFHWCYCLICLEWNYIEERKRERVWVSEWKRKRDAKQQQQ